MRVVSLLIISILLLISCRDNPSKDFLFTFEGYPPGDTVFLQFGPEYRSPRYPILISEGKSNYINDSIGNTLGVGLYIAYVLRTTATPSEMKLWLDNHKRFSEDEHYKRIMAIYIPQSKTDLGMKLEDFQAIDLNGNRFSLYEFLQDFKGKAIIIDFWASWCHACREKVPHLKNIYGKYKNRGLEIIEKLINQTSNN